MIKYVFFSVWVGRSNASQCIAHDEEDGRANWMQVQYRAHEYRRMNAKLAVYIGCAGIDSAFSTGMNDPYQVWLCHLGAELAKRA